MKLIILIFTITLILNSCNLDNNKNAIIDDPNILTDQNIESKIDWYLNILDLDNALILLEQQYNKNKKDIINTIRYANILAMKWSITYQEHEYANKAIKILTDIINEYPLEKWNNMDTVRRMLWYSYEIIEDYDNAIKNYELAIELNENNSEAYNNLWHAYKLLWENDKAIKYFEKSLSINPNYDQALSNMWMISLAKWDLIKTKEYLEKVIKISENKHFKSEAYYTLWNIIMLQANSSASWITDLDILNAKQMFEKSKNSNPNFDLPYIWLARLEFYKFHKDIVIKWQKADEELYDSSLNNLKKALKINPNKALAYYELAYIYDTISKEEEANSMIDKALEVVNNDITLSKTEKENFIKDLEKFKKGLKITKTNYKLF